MKKLPLLILGLALVVACQKEKTEEPAAKAADILILNNGNWGGNDASISGYDIHNKTVSSDVFYAVNNQKLGDLGQDILRYGDYLLIAVNGSKVVYVTDLELKIVATIAKDLSPRYLAATKDRIYVTYYEGFLGEIDPADWSVKTTAVGPNPEGLAIVGGKVYVANSGGYVPGYNNTVSVVEIASFKEVSTITVNTNPAKIVAVDNSLYINSFGDYKEIPAKLQKIDLKTSEVSDLDLQGVNAIAAGKDEKLFVLSGEYNASWQLEGTLTAVDGKTGKVETKLADGISNAYSVSASGDYVFVGCSDYTTDGSVMMFKTDGSLVETVSSEGLNPIACLVL